MGTLKYGGTRFAAYPADHTPRHVHGLAEGVIVIVELRADGTAVLADRNDAVAPRNAKRSAVRKIVKEAGVHFDELVALWEEAHG